LQDYYEYIVIHYFIFVASYVYKISKLSKFMTILSLKGISLVGLLKRFSWCKILFAIN